MLVERSARVRYHHNMFRIWKSSRFSASHQLNGLPEDHQCSRLHGHNYTIEVELTAPGLDEVGFVKDFGALADLKDYIDREWDHRHLNDLLPYNPTAENMARHLYNWCKLKWPETSAIRVQETATSWAEYRP